MKKRTVAFIISCIVMLIALAISLGISEVSISVSYIIMFIAGHIIAGTMIIGSSMHEAD